MAAMIVGRLMSGLKQPAVLIATAWLITVVVVLTVIWGLALADHSHEARKIVYTAVLAYCFYLAVEKLGGMIMRNTAVGALSAARAAAASTVSGFNPLVGESFA